MKMECAIRAAILISCGLAATGANAQQPIKVCPNGAMIEAYRSCEGFEKRVADPSYHGAIAIDTTSGRAGYASVPGGLQEAQQLALANCAKNGGASSQCEIVGKFVDKCAVVAASIGNGKLLAFGQGVGNTSDVAAKKALKDCDRQAKGASCEIWVKPFCAKLTPFGYTVGAAAIKRAMGQDPEKEKSIPHGAQSGSVSIR